MKISNSKKQLAKIISENGGWRDGSNWSAQDKKSFGVGPSVWFYGVKPERHDSAERWSGTSVGQVIDDVNLVANWHQTLLSRDEYFHLYPVPDADGWIEWIEWKGGLCPVDIREVVDIQYREGTVIERADAGCFEWQHYALNTDIIAYRLHKPEQSKSTAVGDDETNLAAKEELEALEFEPSAPTIEQLAAEYRNRKDYAERKQQEADAAKAEAEAKLAELVAAGKALGLVVGVAGHE